MPDVQPLKARSTAFIDNGDGAGVYIFKLEDGACVRIQVTLTQSALHLEDVAKAIANHIRKQEKK